eukprot:TRINITY_DN15260_c0_g1_i1.p1 TRINITY_DN15260_c0_g1~~TRINITY_DN15260_c0_g1_i1.p1  ORF type:complete len:638 (+),score=235.20 TRINITY_DN15260_c0_g1_i1:137-2050(+)
MLAAPAAAAAPVAASALLRPHLVAPAVAAAPEVAALPPSLLAAALHAGEVASSSTAAVSSGCSSVAAVAAAAAAAAVLVSRRRVPAAAQRAGGARCSLLPSAQSRRGAAKSPVALAAKSRYGTWADPEPLVLNEGPKRPVKVRFAPSPTGVLHVGGARTALFNWLFAKSQGGEMVLRIEDTDFARSTLESEKALLEDLKWLGLSWQEGPDIGGPAGLYRQSERIKAGIYEEKLKKLEENGNVYRCFLTEKELDAMRAEAERQEQAFVLQSPWATASKEDVEAKLAEGAQFVWRFRVPFDREIIVNDLVVGEVIWNSDELGGDFVIVRKSGIPMYNFGVVVDDAAMGITHVLRAQEHLMNTPRQILIYKALGLEVPTFAHMPLILAPDRSKLSKRHGAVAVGDYMRKGYLASGMINYLSQLGWNDGTEKEIYSLEELVEAFKMERMSKVSAIFDLDKFKWVNANHVRLLPEDQVVSVIGEELKEKGVVKEASGEFVDKAAHLLQDRISVLSEAAQELTEMLQYPLEAFLESDEEHVEDGSFRETAQALLSEEAKPHLEALAKGDKQAVKTLAKIVSEARGGVKKKALLRPFRLCLTASDRGPDLAKLFDMLSSADDNIAVENVMLPRRLEMLKEALKL